MNCSIRTALLTALLLCLAPAALQAQTLSAAAHRAHAGKLEAKNDYAAAIAEYQQAYGLDKTTHLEDATLDLNKIGNSYLSLSQYPKALEFFQRELALERKIGDKSGEAASLNNVGLVSQYLSQYDKALDFYQQALSLERKAGDKAGEAGILGNIGMIYNSQGQYARALNFFQQALPIQQQLADKAGEALILVYVGEVYWHLGAFVKALGYYQQALPIERKAGNKAVEATTLNDIGAVYLSLSQYAQALDYDQQALLIERQIGDKAHEAAALSNIGAVYDHLSQYDKALDAYQQALPIRHQVGDKAGEALTLSNLGAVYQRTSQYAKALDFYQQALPIEQQIGDKAGEAVTLNNIGLVYRALSQYAKALDYFQQALPIQQQIGDKADEATTLSNLGAVYDDLSQYAKSLDFYGQALLIEQQIGDKADEARTLNNLGLIYRALSQYAKALDYFQQALPIQQQIGDKADEATTLNNLGVVYDYLSQYAKVLDFYGQALPIEQQIGDKANEANTLNNLMSTWKSLGQPGVAVFYGKQAVNVKQSIRRNISTLDKQSQKSYLAANAVTYRDLADLLIGQGRLGEAEAVLALLKEAEYRDFNGTDRALAAQPNAPVPLTADEAQWQADYAALGDTLEHLNQQATELAKIDTRTPDQEAQYRTLTAKLDKADAAFQTFLGQLAKHFQEAGKGNAAVLTVQQDQKMQNALARWSKAGTRVAALYTVEADTQYAVILVTPNGSRPGATAITAADLNKKIEAFRQALTNKDVDPRPLGQELYHILVGPVEKDLNAYDPQVVMWSLDGLIRYLPVAALHDGQHYLVERWQNTLFDPASLPDLDQTRTDWHQAQALGLGVSMEHHVKTATQDDEFPALTHVPEELDGIISDPKQAGASGVLPGQVRLDAGFTRQATLDALRGHTHPLVHIATHFRFDAAQAEQSYLLLGDGGQISLADLRRPGLFGGVDLLTLSACSTALGQANADGKEVDSLGRTAEDDGAQAVIASLWSVSDASTAQLMEALYRDLQQGSSVSKAAALQSAQLSLLRGSSVSPVGDVSQRGTEAVPSRGEQAGLPAFVADPKAPYAHPFYWAPFILIGNWR